VASNPSFRGVVFNKLNHRTRSGVGDIVGVIVGVIVGDICEFFNFSN
jgi:hypothetical protein